MPVLKGDLQADGAVVNIRVGWSHARAQKLRQSLRPVPPPMTVRALLDTGAEITCIDHAIVKSLGLPFGGTVFANVPTHGGFAVQILCDISLTLLHPAGTQLITANLNAMELSLAGLGYEALIGRDVLNHHSFLYHGRLKKFRLAF
jgi:hypothetical protein